MATLDKDYMQTIYKEISSRLQKIDDFRAKLLGFLPLASGTGLFLLFGRSFGNADFRTYIEPYLLPVGLFGFMITLGLFFYEIRGIQRCNFLIKRGAAIENLIRIQGQFNAKLPPKLGFIRATTAAYVIYPAVFGVWVFLGIQGYTGKCMNIPKLALWVFGSSFLISILLCICQILSNLCSRSRHKESENRTVIEATQNVFDTKNHQ